MGLDINDLYLPDDNKPKLPAPNIPNQNRYEQMTLSPSVIQITMDYLYVRKQLVDAGADVYTDMGQDVVLSIVCDAYNHEVMKRKIQFVKVDQCDNDPTGRA